MVLPNTLQDREFQKFQEESGELVLNIVIVPSAGYNPVFPGVNTRGDLEFRKFTTDGSGNPAIRAILVT